MKSNYDPLGKHIRLVDYRNSEEVTSTVLGISIDKEFMPSVANVIGTDLSRYKLISKGLFACNPMHVGRDERLPIALYEKDSPAIVSPAYFMFEIIDRDVLNEEYLMMWFRRPEFDRECWFMTDGSVRGGITWDDLCRIKLPVPSYARQCEIVESYRAITDRIALKRAENDNLEAAMRALFEHFVVSNEAYDFDEAIDDKIDFINGLAMQNYRPEKDETPIPVIKIRELSQGYCDENSEFCSNHIDKSHIIQNGDLVFSWSGSLQASFWTSQTAGLNQHLFKVQSDEYPLWFVYEWVTFHLLNFQRIAENKGTTFGHIKREDLHNAKIKSVGIDEINKLNNLFQPLLNTIIANSTELHSLMNYQRVLLARLSR